MFKKTIGGILLIGLIAVLVIGAIQRTQDRTALAAELEGRGKGNNASASSNGSGGTNGSGGRGSGNDNGNGNGNGRLASGEIIPSETWETFEGTVVEALEGGGEFVIETTAGETVAVGTGPVERVDPNFALQAGESVRVQGYWEDGEFKAAQITRLADGQTLALRDTTGRPAWAGGGQGEQTGESVSTGQAEVEEWLEIEGTVVSVDTDGLVIATANGQQLSVENRPWSFAQEQGFWTQMGNQITLTGFDEAGDFEVGQIVDHTTGSSVTIREENGRPMWAGRGRGGR